MYVKEKWGLQIYCNERTAHELDDFETTLFNSLDLIQVNDDLCILPVPVPHSGSENVVISTEMKMRRNVLASHDGERCSNRPRITWTMSLSDMLEVVNTYLSKQIMMTGGYKNGPYSPSILER